MDALDGGGMPSLEQLLSRRGPARTYSLEELRVLNAHREDLNGLKPDEIDWILRSELFQANDSEAQDVVYWTRRSADYADEHAVNH
jgi:hypothetical protein